MVLDITLTTETVQNSMCVWEGRIKKGKEEQNMTASLKVQR